MKPIKRISVLTLIASGFLMFIISLAAQTPKRTFTPPPAYTPPPKPSYTPPTSYQLPKATQENLDASRRQIDRTQQDLDSAKQKHTEQTQKNAEQFKQSQIQNQKTWDDLNQRTKAANDSISRSLASPGNHGPGNDDPNHPYDFPDRGSVNYGNTSPSASASASSVSLSASDDLLARKRTERARVAEGRIAHGVQGLDSRLVVDYEKLSRLDREIADLEQTRRSTQSRARTADGFVGSPDGTRLNGDGGSGTPSGSVAWNFPQPVPGGKTFRNGVWIDKDGYEIESGPMTPAQASAWQAELADWRRENDLYYKRITNQRNDESLLRDRAVAEWEHLYKSGVVTWQDNPAGQLDPLRFWLEKKKDMDVTSASALVDVGLKGFNFVSDTEKYVEVLANQRRVEKMESDDVSPKRILADLDFQSNLESLRYTTGELQRKYGNPATEKESKIDAVLENARSQYQQKAVAK